MTFRNGKSAGSGGAIYFNGSGKVENCTFADNTASEYGGAAYIEGNVTVTNCNFTNNSATAEGGAIYFLETADVSDCTFANNKATTNGGAIEFTSGGSVENCNFTNNTANKDGGAIYFDKSGNVTTCNFNNNTADKNGGAINFYSTGNVINCNFAGNMAKGNDCYGGAVWIKSGSVENCNFTDNKTTGLESKGSAIYFENDGTVINCIFTNHNSVKAGAVYFYNNANVINCNFTNNSNALFIVKQGNVKSCNFINNKESYETVGAVRVNYGHVINCNFLNNTVSKNYCALETFKATVENCTFINNSASNKGGALRFFYDGGKAINCNFTNNKATSGRGGAIYFSDKGEVTNCYFTNNTANEGGAVYFEKEGKVAGCNFADNKAITGSAIYFNYNKDGKSISNSSFLNNRANANADNPLTVTINENNIAIIFKGQNNYLNAIYSRYDREVSFTNVTYWGAKGIANTDTDAPVKSNCEAGQNITVKGVANGNILDIISVTDDEGKIVLDISVADNYYISVRHDEDSYYTEAEKVISKNMTYNVNVTSQTTHNKTVNITAKSDIFNEVLPGRLLFILPDGTKINATYASNGTWWAVHTFDNYTEYDVNASYVGLDNVTFKNATINITKADSTITLDNISLDYGNSINVTVTTEGATRITAKINDNDVDVIDNYTIPISGLGAGNYTLTVTTIPDNDHNSVTKTVNITVNKRFTEITLTNETLDLKAKDIVDSGAALIPGDAGTLNYTSSNEDIVKVENGKIIAVEAGKADITVSFAGNDNNTAAESRNIAVTVTPIDTNVNVNKTKFELVVGGEADIIANATPEGLVIDYATDNTDIISVDKNGHITALSNGTALIFVSVGDNRIYDYDYVDVFVTVKKTTGIDVKVVTDENNVTITATVDDTASGLVKFNISGKTVYIGVENGKAVYDLVLPAGNYNVEATYLGDINFDSNRTSESFTVSGHVKQNTNIISNVVVNNDTATITVSVDENATGFVTVTISGKTFIVPVEKGKAVFINDYQPGTYTANITYLGDNDFNTNNTNTTFTITEPKVELKNTTIDVNVETSENDVTITATVDSFASGLVEFNIGGRAVYIAVNNGKAVYNTNLPAGDYNVEVIYLGNSKFNANRTSKEFRVAGHVKQNTTIVSDVNVDNYNVTIKVTVNENATGFVKFTLNGNDVFAEVNGGKAIINTMLPVGNYTIPITYLGDDDFNTNTTDIEVKVVEIPLKNTPIIADIELNENNVTITVTLDSNATGLVKFDVTGTEEYSLYVEIEDGKAILEDVLTTGEYTAQITYLGNEEFNPNSTTKTFTVIGHIKNDTTISAVPSVDNSTVTIETTVDSNATGQVTIAILGQTFIVPVNDGKAVFAYDFNPDTYSAVVTYLGDDNFNNATTTVSFTVTEHVVELKNTTIGVDVVVDENDVTITANVDASATGLVEFNIGGRAVYVAVNNGKAVYNVDLPAGDYTVVATYLGDSKFNANKTSKAFTVYGHVKKNTTIFSDVVVDENNVTITVDVDKDATGFVEFTLNGNDLFAEVVGGKAVLSLILPVGNYTVAATYLGDDDFNANSTSVEVSVEEIPLKDTSIDVNIDIKDNNITIVAVVDSNATGLVKFEVTCAEEHTLYAEINNGKAVFEYVLAKGDYVVVITYLGDENFYSNTTSESFTVVGHVKKDTAIVSVPNVDNSTVTIETSVDSNATGQVTIAILGQTFIVPVNDGKAVFTYDFIPGIYSAVVTYLGDDNFNNASTVVSFTVTEHVVELKNTTIGLDVSSDENHVVISVDVDASATGLVEFNIGGRAVYVAVNNGKAVYNVDLPAGDYTVVATYLGDSKFNSNKTSKAFTVHGHVKRNTTISADVVVDENNVTIAVDVDNDATGFVKFT